MEHLNERNVFDFARAQFDRATVDLDLSTFQPDRIAASILTAAILTKAPAAPLRLKVPPVNKQEALARNGLLFAFANRPGPVSFEPENPRLDRHLEEWRRPWTRGTRSPLLPLGLDGGLDIEPSIVGPNHAAFVNPHRAGGAPGSNSGVADAVRPWLHRLLPKLATAPERTTTGPEFVKAVGTMIDELVENVVEHAALGNSLDVFSLVLVSIARGNKADTRHRLYIAVVDTGPGIIETAARKITGRKRPGQMLVPATLLRDLFIGRSQDLGRARGYGLPYVWETVRCWSGARLVATANEVLLRSDGEDLETMSVAPVVTGTIITATFPLPPQRHDAQQ